MWFLTCFLSPWITGGCLFLLISFLIFLRIFYWSKRLSPKQLTKQERIANLVSQVLPIHSNNGWSFERTSEGLRIFKRYFDTLQTRDPYSLNNEVFGASLIVDLTPKRALSLVSSLRELSCWISDFPATIRRIHQQDSSQLIQFTCRNTPKGYLQQLMWLIHSRVSSWSEKYVPFMESLIPSAPQQLRTELVERYWHTEGGLSYLFSCPRQPSSLSYMWSCLFLTSLHRPGVCLVTLAMLPQHGVDVSPLISGQLCALREHITMRYFKVHKTSIHRNQKVKVQDKLCANDEELSERLSDETNLVTDASENIADTSPIILEYTNSFPLNSPMTTPPPLSPETALDSPVTTPPPLSPEAALDAKYLNRALECTNKLVAMTREGLTDGWLEVGTKKGVHVMKKYPEENGPMLNSIQGTGHINVPPEFLLRLLKDPLHSTKLDEMLKETRVIHGISSAVHLVQLLYKPVWPTYARDFSCLSIAGQVDNCTWISSGMSITDYRIPEEKGYVRADLVSGGYVIQSVPDNSEMSLVTYGACVDLKGSIPAFVVNKITESQPMCINLLRKLAVPIYQEMKDDPQKMELMREEFLITSVNTKKEAVSNGIVSSGVLDHLADTQWHFDPSSAVHKEESPQSSVIGTDQSSTVPVITSDSIMEEVGYVTPVLGSEDETEDTNVEINGHIIPETMVEDCDTSLPMQEISAPTSLSTPNLALLPRYTLDNVDDMEISLDLNSQFLTNETISYPRCDSGQVDYRTLANQTAARVLEEVFHVSNLDLSDPSTFCDQSGGWSFDGVEKEVLLLSKRSPDLTYTCFMGRGVIPLPPQYVFDSLRNPQLRFTYDNMLKELHIVRQIEDGLYILHLHHETTQCFIKQARDFCILVSERSEPNKKLLIGTSIETPECPPNPNLQRGKIYCSGWIVEPSHHINGKVCTHITYLLRMNVGGIPSSLMNYISKRQPLAVAYLREYLVSTSLEQN